MWISKSKFEFLIASSHEYALEASLLTKRLSDLTVDLTRERQRADNAIDELLATKGLAPISPPPPQPTLDDPDPFSEVVEEADRWRKYIEERGLVPALETAKVEG